jgi:ligand-binding sensor domain-containing protein/signal transduction histidine kinase
MPFIASNLKRLLRLAIGVTLHCQLQSAVPLSVVHWGTEQGLEAGPLTCVLQTRDGYLWLGGEEGLMRFDGVKSTVFSVRTIPQLKAKSITTLYEDDRGGLWVGTAGGGLAFRSSEGTWESYGPANGLKNERVTTITQDSTRCLWIGTDGGGIFISRTHGRFEAFAQNSELPTQHIEKLLAAEGDTIWIGSGRRLSRIRGDLLDTAFAPTGEIPASSFAVTPAAEGGLWVGGREGLFLLRTNRFSRFLPEFQFGMIQALELGSGGRLWVGTRNGLVRLDGNKATRLGGDGELSGKIIRSVFRDGEGSIWVTSEAPGIDQIRNTKFASLGVNPAHGEAIVTAVYEDSLRSLWFGSHAGLSRIDQMGNTTHWDTEDGLAADMIFSICEGESSQAIWVSTSGGLNRWNNGKWQLLGRQSGIPHRITWCLLKRRNGEVWAGTLGGLARIEAGNVAEVFRHDSGLTHSDVRALSEDAAGRLWIGTSYGLNLFEGAGFKQFVEGAPGVPFNAVIALYGDAEGDLWIGTLEQGLFRWRDGEFTRFHSGVGLHDDLIFQILEDATGHLWMSCNRGIFRVSKAHLNSFAAGNIERIECAVFGKSDGMPSIECNGTFQPAGWRSNDGRLWFPTAKGVAVVDPANLSRNSRLPPVRIEQVFSEGRKLDLSNMNPIKLGPGARDLLIRYTALSFIAPAQVQFRYRLDGVDTDWLPETTERSARFTHLPPGKYRFRVIAANNDGIWNEDGAVLAFQVLPFWWQTRSFIVLSALTTVVSVGGAVRLWTARRYRRRMADLEHQHNLERERNRIASDLHDDVGSNLGSIALLSASARRHASGEAVEDFSEIQHLAESTAEAMRDIVWFINSSEDELHALVLRMRETAGRLLSGLAWTLEAPAQVPERKLSTEFKRHFFLIFKESLHNVRKHARATSVIIEVSFQDEKVELVISDDGVGFPQGMEHSGLGLSSMKRRALAQNWDVVIRNNVERGAQVRLIATLTSQPEASVP